MNFPKFVSSARCSLFGFVLIERAHSGKRKKRRMKRQQELKRTEWEKKSEVFVWKTPYLGCFWGDPNRAMSK